MKRIACFCIPAHGHTNPILPVLKELVQRGNEVRFYSFEEFRRKIEQTGAQFVSCDRFLETLNAQEEARLKQVSATEMSIQAIRITKAMDGFLDEEFQTFQPDVIFTDSACFWGKLTAAKHQIPMVVSTSTFAFNQISAQYMKNSLKEIADLVFGLPRVMKELKTLEPLGYHISNPLSLVQSDNQTDSIVYTSHRFQPYADSFSDHYLFAGPSTFSSAVPSKNSSRPLVYISMGTVINDRPDFYRNCIEGLKDLPVEGIISCGTATDISSFGELPKNIQIFPSVDQPEVLSKASAFISHCGMNSTSESLYMAAPMILYPQTNEQNAAARRVYELGAGIYLKDDSAEGIRNAVKQILSDPSYQKDAELCSSDFRSCPGPKGAADFIEQAPHPSSGQDPLVPLNRENWKFQTAYWLCAAVLILITGLLSGWKYVWLTGILCWTLSGPAGKLFQKHTSEKLFHNERTVK